MNYPRKKKKAAENLLKTEITVPWIDFSTFFVFLSVLTTAPIC